MARSNKTRYALLGILSMGPASGYDIKLMMQKSTDYFWKEGDASIYPILKQLLKEKLVIVKLCNAKSGKPKKIYTITKAGKNMLRDWLMRESEPNPVRNELLLKVFFGWNADLAVIIDHVHHFANQIEKRLNRYRSLSLSKANPAKLGSVELYQYLTLRAGILNTEANLKWCDEAIQLLKNK